MSTDCIKVPRSAVRGSEIGRSKTRPYEGKRGSARTQTYNRGTPARNGRDGSRPRPLVLELDAAQVYADEQRLTDVVCLAIALWIASGLYMWWGLQASRSWGWLAIGAGATSFVFFMVRL